ncbi:FixH family protein [Pseudomonas sp. RIT-PI-S]|uniref:FixH family protein n=1 Tax=Pseudomonas sp. RIT-PI-S TaxID=3035295 RepID=UPI0021D958A5|nr:FixH family protein [Pseudomonas sp. RIT-PI-S]
MNTGAWYRHRWPWFIFGLMLASIGGTLLMVTISLRQPDGLVTDQYYAAGLGIDRSLARERLARQLGQQAVLRIDQVTGQVDLQLTGDSQPPQLSVNLLSPTQPEQDAHLTLNFSGQPGRYLGHLDTAVTGRRFIEVLGEQQGQPWRLFEEEWLAPGTDARLGDEPLPGELRRQAQ